MHSKRNQSFNRILTSLDLISPFTSQNKNFRHGSSKRGFPDQFAKFLWLLRLFPKCWRISVLLMGCQNTRPAAPSRRYIEGLTNSRYSCFSSALIYPALILLGTIFSKFHPCRTTEERLFIIQYNVRQHIKEMIVLEGK